MKKPVDFFHRRLRFLLPRPGGPETPGAPVRRGHRRTPDFSYLPPLHSKKGRPSIGRSPFLRRKQVQSIFKSSICSPEGPVKNQFSSPPKVLGITHFSGVRKVSTPTARRSAAAWSTSST